MIRRRGKWSAANNPSTPRANHVAVRLQNGKVLITSGNGAPFSNVLTSAELYDPATGNWSAAGSLSVARQSPRAVLLADGHVLVCGGFGAGGAINSAEVYDPATNAWSAAGVMNAARIIHTLTLLPNGKVLAAGGAGSNFQPVRQNSAELYDPATNSWTPTGELSTPRLTHSAALLPNGKLLISGGSPDAASSLASAELYDPASGQWSATGSMTTQRVIHTLTLLPNGKVLAAAGGAGSNATTSTSAELYDLASGQWSAATALNAARSNHTATLLLNGKALITGGNGPLASAELYDSGAAGLASVSAASFTPGGAPEAIVAAFGANLAATTQAAASVPLPTELAGVSVRVRDGAGVERLAPLFFVAPGQLNYQLPAGTAPGTAYITVSSGAAGIVEIASAAPGLFTANANGQGVPAAVALRVRADGSQSFEPVARFDAAQNRFVTAPIDLGPESEQVFLVLFGTGIRFRSALAAVTASIGGANSEVLFADALAGLVGLDQVNVRIPRGLAGRGEVDVALAVDGVAANTVRVSLR